MSADTDTSTKPTTLTVSQIRQATKLSHAHKLHRTTQAEFAELLGIPAATVRAWEQGAKQPTAAALTLLRLVAKHPDTVVPQLEDMAAKRAAKQQKAV
ncbi:helix-turn-helix domain-containing protein [Bergeriella denitrificans]|uniref:Putative transcriptional regulator n=1 Tax=Bergeriella denitrificans TaxID=494 RepID=A0A378UHP2_BERDE|nr:helix-turn-helix domain-containing protein [Bergeriella denitrificans]STZ76846.1 putative transcriptional regulator [Bergeriella denitrificans]